MRRSHSVSETSVGLFAFLDVLMSTMGSLILVLIIVTPKIQKEKVARAAAEAAKDVVKIEAAPAPAPAPVVRPRETIDLNAKFATHVADLASEADAKRRAAADVQQAVALAQERAQKAHAEREKLERQLAALNAAKDQALTSAEDLSAEGVKVETELARRASRLRKIRDEIARASTEYAFVAYDGVSGTTRRPILIECVNDQIRFPQEDITLTSADITGFNNSSNPLLAGAEALLDYWSTNSAPRDPKPYVLMVVRPSGTLSYYRARNMLERMQAPFGYELLPEDQKLAVPPPNEKATAACRRAIDNVIAKRDSVFGQVFATTHGPSAETLRGGHGWGSGSSGAPGGGPGKPGTRFADPFDLSSDGTPTGGKSADGKNGDGTGGNSLVASSDTPGGNGTPSAAGQGQSAAGQGQSGAGQAPGSAGPSGASAGDPGSGGLGADNSGVAGGGGENGPGANGTGRAGGGGLGGLSSIGLGGGSGGTNSGGVPLAAAGAGAGGMGNGGSPFGNVGTGGAGSGPRGSGGSGSGTPGAGAVGPGGFGSGAGGSNPTSPSSGGVGGTGSGGNGPDGSNLPGGGPNGGGSGNMPGSDGTGNPTNGPDPNGNGAPNGNGGNQPGAPGGLPGAPQVAGGNSGAGADNQPGTARLDSPFELLPPPGAGSGPGASGGTSGPAGAESVAGDAGAAAGSDGLPQLGQPQFDQPQVDQTQMGGAQQLGGSQSGSLQFGQSPSGGASSDFGSAPSTPILQAGTGLTPSGAPGSPGEPFGGSGGGSAAGDPSNSSTGSPGAAGGATVAADPAAGATPAGESGVPGGAPSGGTPGGTGASDSGGEPSPDSPNSGGGGGVASLVQPGDDTPSMDFGKRQWGYSTPQANVGFNHDVTIWIGAHSLVVGGQQPLRISRAESAQRLAAMVVPAMDREARTWGRPPAHCYWVPNVKFVISPGGNVTFERLRPLIERHGLVSTVEYRLELESPRQTFHSWVE